MSADIFAISDLGERSRGFLMIEPRIAIGDDSAGITVTSGDEISSRMSLKVLSRLRPGGLGADLLGKNSVCRDFVELLLFLSHTSGRFCTKSVAVPIPLFPTCAQALRTVQLCLWL